MTNNFHSITRRGALLLGAAAATAIALPTSFGFAANAASTTTPIEGDNRMGYITTKDGDGNLLTRTGARRTPSRSSSTTAGRSASDDWDAQMLFFLCKGYRVVAA